MANGTDEFILKSLYFVMLLFAFKKFGYEKKRKKKIKKEKKKKNKERLFP